MVASIYIKQYYDFLIQQFADQGLNITVPNKQKSQTSQGTVFYVPGASIDDMFRTVREELAIEVRAIGGPVLFIGYARGPINRFELSRRAERSTYKNATTGSFRKAQQVIFNLQTFCISNIPEIIEDIEEIYNVITRYTQSVNIDMGVVPEADHPQYAITTQHDDIDFSGPVDESEGNLFACSFSQNLIGYAFELNEEERTRLVELRLNLFNNILDAGHLIKTIVKP